MKRLPIILVLLVGCASPETRATTTTGQSITTTIMAATSTTTPVECPTPPYELGFLPRGVGANLDLDTVEPDVWTSVPGISATLWGRADDTVGMALIRGTLPAVDWPAEKGEVFVDGTRGAVGPHPDGTWVAGWFEAPGDRCDLYTLVVYPPVAPEEVKRVIEAMNRVGG